VGLGWGICLDVSRCCYTASTRPLRVTGSLVARLIHVQVTTRRCCGRRKPRNGQRMITWVSTSLSRWVIAPSHLTRRVHPYILPLRSILLRVPTQTHGCHSSYHHRLVIRARVRVRARVR
jgi:hypothetical protein